MGPTVVTEAEVANGCGSAGGTGGGGPSVVDSLSKILGEISGLPECRGPLRRPYCDLARRVKLLSPLFEELRDGSGLGEGEAAAFVGLDKGLEAALELFRSVNEGSKLYQALNFEDYVNKFLKVTTTLEKALSEISFDKLAISEEVKEQILLIHAQFKRAKGTIDSSDSLITCDLSMARSAKNPDPAVLRRLSEKLELRSINDLKRESLALHEMVISSGGEPEDCLEDMSALLKKLKDCVLTENPNVDSLDNMTSLAKLRSPVIPEDFRCPISLEIMKDPVIVSTGQTYERAAIQKWLNAGHKTCPKTQQPLTHIALTPNYLLKSLIAQWCESNGVDLPKQQGPGQNNRAHSCNSDCDRAGIELLMHKLKDGNQEEKRAAAGQLRLLAKRNADNRVCIADAGAIPLLVRLLSSSDPRTQEHAVTALLNLSINESNKNLIVFSNAVPEIVKVLKKGSMEARENAAATLFSLSVIEGNKVAIGAAGAIPALVELLCEGSPRGKKDAATAIFNLAIYPDNKVKAAEAGIVVHLMRLMVDPSGGMVDEALAILTILATHPQSKASVVNSKPIPVLVGLMKTGSSRNRENAAAVLWSLCNNDAEQLSIARESGAEEALKELSDCGTDRAKRKAAGLLDLLRKSGETS